MRHYQKFTVEVEGWIVHRSDMSVRQCFENPCFHWRACVRVASKLHWEWCKSETDALQWVNKWKLPFKTVHDLTLNP